MTKVTHGHPVIITVDMTKSPGPDQLAQVMAQTALFAAVSPEDLLPLVRKSSRIRREPGEIVFFAGEKSSALYLVISGRTRALRQSPDGREQVIHEDGPNSTFPEVAVFDGGPYPSTVVAVEQTLLLRIPKEDVLRFCMNHPAVALAALKRMSARLRKATGMVEDFALRDVSQRLAEYLLREQSSSGVDFQLRHSNQEIADLIGTVREVVSRSFAKLQRKGWVKRQGRRITILDEEALQHHVQPEV